MKRGNPLGKCLGPISFECIDFHGLSQIIASFTRENFAEREAEIQTEKDNALANGLRAWRAKKPMLCLHAVADEDGHPLENKMNQAEGYVIIGVQSFRRALKAKGTTTMRTSCDTFRKLLMTSAGKSTKTSLTNSLRHRRNPLQALMRFRSAVTGVRGDWVRRFYSTRTNMVEGGTVPALFAESRTVFIPKSSDVDNNGRIVRSPEALRPLTLCNCDCKILTTASCRGLHWYTMR